MRRLIIFALGWLIYAPVYAAQSTTTSNYEVEVLVFETQIPEFEGAEVWTRTPRTPESNVITVDTAAPSGDFASAINAMRNDGRYRVLLHKRWAQAAEAKSARPPILLSTAGNELNGTFRFYLSRFLHVEMNLAYHPASIGAGALGNPPPSSSGTPPAATTADATPTDGPISFVINEQRRIKSNDMNYFDHPKFGVLVRVTPVPG